MSILIPISSQDTHTQGHLGHLTTAEEGAFKAFKERCAANGLLQDPPGNSEDDLMAGISDDGTLLRFLRARKFNVQDAYNQYSPMRAWRERNELISLYDSIDIKDYEETRKLYTHWTGRRDKHGIPLLVFEIAQLSSPIMSAYTQSCASSPLGPKQPSKGGPAPESTAMLRLCCTYDSLVRFVLPLCSAVRDRPDPGTPITQTNCIVDVSGVSLLQFWRLRSHLQAASTLATSYYPETLGRTYIIGAPAFFPTIWSWINKMFDPVTVSKIRIVPHHTVLATLAETIDPANIPRQYGGHLDYTFGMMPILDPAIAEMLEWGEEVEGATGEQVLPIGPIRWVGGEEERRAVAVGSVGGGERRVEVFRLKG